MRALAALVLVVWAVVRQPGALVPIFWISFESFMMRF